MSIEMPSEMANRCISNLRAQGVAVDDIRTCFVPGRIELLGKHTDYCGGRSAICAIDRGFSIAYAPFGDRRVRLAALNLDDVANFEMSPDIEPTVGRWDNYPMTVARRIARNFAGPLRGATIACASTLPPAAGMSSSSALVVGMYLVFDAINGLTDRLHTSGAVRSDAHLAEYLGTIENGRAYGTLAGDRGVGTFGGSEDHTAITLGRAGSISVYGFAPTRHERDVDLPEGQILAIATSGVLAEKTGAARDRYNRASSLVSQLVSLWSAREQRPPPSLAAIVRQGRDSVERLRSIVRDDVPDPTEAVALFRRLDHFIVESEQIIPTAMDALASGDLTTFGAHVDASQRAAETMLRNQVPETVTLARLARDLGATAASAFGAGFGGSVWALVDARSADAFIENWSGLYAEAHPGAAAHSTVFLTRPCDGTATVRRQALPETFR